MNDLQAGDWVRIIDSSIDRDLGFVQSIRWTAPNKGDVNLVSWPEAWDMTVPTEYLKPASLGEVVRCIIENSELEGTVSVSIDRDDADHIIHYGPHHYPRDFENEEKLYPELDMDKIIEDNPVQAKPRNYDPNTATSIEQIRSTALSIAKKDGVTDPNTSVLANLIDELAIHHLNHTHKEDDECAG